MVRVNSQIWVIVPLKSYQENSTVKGPSIRNTKGQFGNDAGRKIYSLVYDIGLVLSSDWYAFRILNFH